MSLSVRTRFEVFKRDRFTCSYCGKNPPDVLLEVDHIVPRAAGGSDEITNLTTACWDCNRGKSDRMLEEGVAPTVTRLEVDSLRERLEQAAEYAALIGTQESLIAKQRQLVIDVWARAFGARSEERESGSFWVLAGPDAVWPNERTISLFLRRLPVSEILAAIDITASNHRVSTDYACRLFYKVCWRRIKGETGPISEPGVRSEHGPGHCVPVPDLDAAVASGDRDARLFRRAIVILARRISSLTGEPIDEVINKTQAELDQ